MSIPIKQEDGQYIIEFKCYEKCFFCGDTTDMWHVKTNNPVCVDCSKKHKVCELPNRFKGE